MQLEDDIGALIGRFATELVVLLRRAPVGELGQLLGVHDESSSRGSVAAWTKRYKLTKAETAILTAVLAGKTRRQIIRARGTAPATIKTQVGYLLHKTGDRSMLAATNRLLREQREQR